MAPRFRLGFLTHLPGRGDPAATYRNAQELFAVADGSNLLLNRAT